MTPNPPLSVKAATLANFQPTTTNESLLLLSTQIQALQDSLEKLKEEMDEKLEDIHEEIKEVKEEQKKANDKYNELEKRVTVEERDKKILIGVMAVVVPALLTVVLDVIFLSG